MKFLSSTAELTRFEDLPLPEGTLESLERLAISTPTEIQRQALPVALSGSDFIAVAQTGSGKTLAFALSILAGFQQRPKSRALILVPSREMALQIERVFAQICPPSAFTVSVIIGGVKDNKQAKQMNKLPRLIIATPGRLNDLLRNNKLLLQGVDMVVVDEADRMLDLGFAPQLKDIQSTMRGTRQTMMYSASFSPKVEAIAQIFMRAEPVMIRSAQAEKPVESLKQKVIFLPAGLRNQQLLVELKQCTGAILLFGGSQGQCEKIDDLLRENSFASDVIHGGFIQRHRSEIVAKFREGKLRILVTSDMMARGLDLPLVEHVVSYELPFEPEDFLHRIGRTARAGRSGSAITFVTPSELKTYRQIKRYLEGAEIVRLGSFFDEP